jgi:hypothetical protein
MRQDILFAGLRSSWSHAYAKIYADKLHEMGFCAKAMCNECSSFVAYSHRHFTPHEVSDVLKQLEGNSENNSEP